METQANQRFLIGEDADILEHFYFEFETVVFQTENIALSLEENPHQPKLVEDLLHNIRKLNSLCLNTNIVPLIEPFTVLENFIAYVKHDFRHEISYPLMLILDRALLAAKEAVDQYSISINLITDIQRAIQPLAHIDQTKDVDVVIKRVVKLLLGEYIEEEQSEPEEVELFDNVDLFGDELDTEQVIEAQPAVEQAPAKRIESETSNSQFHQSNEFDVVQLEMQILSTPSVFQKLSELIDTRQKYWVGRSYFMLSLGIKMNAMMNNVVNPQDLANAIYLHDFPMVSLSDDILYGKDLSEKDFQKIKQHPALARDIARLMGASEACQEMVFQHHERPDGKGYPNQLSGDQICHGAKIIAICDAYFSMTNPKAHRATKRSALRTVAEINACSGSQFDSTWVKVFNLVVKRHKMLDNI